MSKRWMAIVMVLAGALLLGSLAAPASAQELQITGPLAGAPAVRSMRIYREGRFQVQPFMGFTLQDEFSRTILFGAQANYHLTDWFGIGVWGGFGGVHIDTGLTDQVVTRGQTTSRNRLSLPNAAKFTDQIATIDWAVAAQALFIPLRGKLSLFQKLFVDADLYLVAGVAAVGLSERADTTIATLCDGPAASDACLDSQTARASRVAIAPTIGVGLSFYFNQLMALTLELRALPFAWNTSGTDEGGRDENGNSGNGGDFPDGLIDAEDRIFHTNAVFNIGVAFYLPTEARISE